MKQSINKELLEASQELVDSVMLLRQIDVFTAHIIAAALIKTKAVIKKAKEK